MLKNKVLLFVVTCVFLTGVCAPKQSLNGQFEVRELNYYDTQEIEEVCQLFQDKDISEMTGGKNFDNQMNLLSAYGQDEQQKHGKYFICKSIDEIKKVCGIVICTYNLEDGYAEYKAIAVHKDYRRQGIASLIMTHVEKVYIEPMSIKKILIGVFPQNLAAIKCYSKQGFYIPLRDRVQTYYRIAHARLLGKPTNSMGFYMHKDL